VRQGAKDVNQRTATGGRLKNLVSQVRFAVDNADPIRDPAQFLPSRLYAKLVREMNNIRCEIDFPLLATLTPSERLRHAFADPLAVHCARRPGEVMPVLDAAAAAGARGHWCVGFVAHEAAPAFDHALVTKPVDGAPLAWFAEFAAPVSTLLAPSVQNTYQLGDWRTDTNHDEFRQKVESIRADIRDGRFYQVNLTTRLSADFAGDAHAFYRALQAAQPDGYHTFIDTGDAQLLSVSPELFFTLHDGKVTTQPMKGTAPRGDTPEADERIAWELTHSEKERAENLMIVDLLRNDLSRIAEPRSVEVTSLFALQPLPSVWQMTSTINAKLREGLGLPDVFRALFPCGSVTGAPKVEAMRAIRDLEAAARGVYCGAIGYVAPGGGARARACFNVGIRSVWLENGRAHCGVGGGITHDSTVGGEWAEVMYKSRFVRRASKAFELLETIRLEGGSYRLMERHLSRMENSARHFRFRFDVRRVTVALDQAAAAHASGTWRVRLLVDRAGVPRVETLALDSLPDTPTFELAQSSISSDDEFLLHKTTRREIYQTHAPRDAKVFDTLLWNERGELTEFTRANLVVAIDGVRLTPPLSCGLLNGTLRDELVGCGELVERVLFAADLARAEAIWWLNGVRGWVAVRQAGSPDRVALAA
jgi:para-aminobenzoate synthetase/4-amino-4-deoxychorismate lyase